MKIIKHGNPRLYEADREFECPRCECVFEAKHNEYKRKFDVFNCEYYLCKCPECGYEVCEYDY